MRVCSLIIFIGTKLCEGGLLLSRSFICVRYVNVFSFHVKVNMRMPEYLFLLYIQVVHHLSKEPLVQATMSLGGGLEGWFSKGEP